MTLPMRLVNNRQVKMLPSMQLKKVIVIHLRTGCIILWYTDFGPKMKVVLRKLIFNFYANMLHKLPNEYMKTNFLGSRSAAEWIYFDKEPNWRM